MGAKGDPGRLQVPLGGVSEASAKALAMLNVGDRVRFNSHTRPQYLPGVEGVVIDLDQHSATICIHQPVGRLPRRRDPPVPAAAARPPAPSRLTTGARLARDCS
jgi:hypothetical protein